MYFKTVWMDCLNANPQVWLYTDCYCLNNLKQCCFFCSVRYEGRILINVYMSRRCQRRPLEAAPRHVAAWYARMQSSQPKQRYGWLSHSPEARVLQTWPMVSVYFRITPCKVCLFALSVSKQKIPKKTKNIKKAATAVYRSAFFLFIYSIFFHHGIPFKVFIVLWSFAIFILKDKRCIE